ncbi:MAG: ABC transporter permease [Paludibacteraceae bacterium]|nr:ABC transporter permease [Paludibacteraceae bacterium]
MNLELFIAKRIHFEKKGERNVPRPIVRIVMNGIVVSLTVMLIAVGILNGFKAEVREKLIGFGSHIQISSSVSNQTYETQPIQIGNDIIDSLKHLPDVKHAQRFATQPCILKVGDVIQGCVLKGIDHDYEWSFFRNNLKEGDLFQVNDTATTNQTIISKKIAELLGLKVGDSYLSYFIIDGKVRARQLNVSGIYETGFQDYDKLFIMGDIKHVRKLNNWDDEQCSGVEVIINDFKQLDKAQEEAFSVIGNRYDNNGNYYLMRTIKQINPQIFSWLDLLNTNVVIILVLMALVAGFTIISGLLILILERTNMIGLMKAMGATNKSIWKIFFYHAFFLIGKGIIIGNIIGIAVCYLLQNHQIIPLNADDYYVDFVPARLELAHIIIVNICTIVVSAAILHIPTNIIAKISPIKSIKFD